MIKKALLLAISMIAFSLYSQSQEMISHIWGQNALEISLPDNVEVLQEDEEQYVAETPEKDFKILISKTDYMTDNQSEMLSFIEDAGKEMGLQLIDDGQFRSSNMKGAFVEGVDGSGMRSILGVIVSKSEKTTYIFLFQYAEDAGYRIEAMRNSFYQGN